MLTQGSKTQTMAQPQTSMPPEQDTSVLKLHLSKVANERSKQSFAYLFNWFAPKIKHFGYKQFNNDAMAQELLQETMTKVWRKAHLFNPEKGAATTWVYSVMRNTSFDMLRKIQVNKEDTLSDDIWPIAEQQHQDEHIFADHLMDKQIAKYVESLPENQQQIIKGVYFQELSQEQLAKQLGIPLGTVKSRLRLAINKLKKQIGAAHD